MYTVISRAKYYLNHNNIDLLVMFYFINKDWNNLMNNVDYSRKICEKLLDNRKLSKNDTKILGYYKKAIKTNYFEVNKIYSEKLKEYKKKILPKLELILKDIFTETKVKSNMGFIYQPLVGTIKGNALNNGVIFNVENRYSNDFRFFRLITHELIHVVCHNNTEYLELLNNKFYKDFIFDEVFTGTIENICMYKLGIDKIKFKQYRFEGKIFNKKACELEDKIRKYYNSWEKSKNKENFVKYLYEKINNQK